ncbi:DUF4012 domain-containing protein [Patescibacteria group bacterium]|nr:DUF4012 domain-containing protein [Patescibacteria group bacterium]
MAEENLARINPERYPESFKDQVVRAKLIKIQQAVGGGVTTLKELRPGLEVLPALLGHPESKKYLLMFQNDTEKRPTGGFMTAYATLNVESGKVRAEGSQDIYTLDAKFKQRLEPPEPIKKIP